MLTISLPTNATSRSSSPTRASAAPASPRIAREGALLAPPGRPPGRARGRPPGRPPRASPRRRSRGRKRATSTPGGPSRVRRRQAGVGDRLPQALGRVARTHEHRPGGRQPLARQAEEALRFGLDGVLQRAAVDLHRVGRGRLERAGEDHRPHHEVVGERQLRGRAGGHLGDRLDVGLQVVGELLVAQLGEGASLERLVAVGHVHGQQTADVGPVDGAAADRSARLGQAAGAVTSSLPESQSPAASTNSRRSGWRSWQSRWTSCPRRASACARRAL